MIRYNYPKHFCSLPLFLLFIATSFVLGEEPPHYQEHFDLSYYLDGSGKRLQANSKESWEIRRQHIVFSLEQAMGSFPRPEKPVPLEMKVLEETRIGKLTRKLVSYHTDSPQDVVTAYLFLPAGEADQKLPAVLCLHQTTRIGKGEPAGLGTRLDLAHALQLAERGFVTLAPDYPSFGDYKYDFDPKHGYVSGSMKAVFDNVRAIDLLVSLPQVDHRRIGCIGHSLGGHNTLLTAVFDSRIKAVVTSCGFTTFQKDDMPSWTGPVYMPLIASKFGNDANRLPFDYPEILAAIAPRSIFVCAPTKDDDFDVSGVKDCVASARPIFKLLGNEHGLVAEYPEASHSFPAETRRHAYEFLEQELR